MKKVLFALVALLIASPAMAHVDLVIVDAGGGVAEVWYYSGGVSAETSKPRAFALNITVDAGSIDAVDPCELFPIYPGNIDLTDPQNPNWGSCVAPGSAPDNPGQLGSQAIVVEMGSLYEAEVDPAPEPNGLLLRVQLGGSCNMSITSEDIYRGGVVLEDVTQPIVDVNDATNVAITCEIDCWDYDCFDCGDGNGDCFISFADLGLIIDSWGGLPYNRCADYNKDTFISFADIGVLIDHWGAVGCTPCGPCTPVSP